MFNIPEPYADEEDDHDDHRNANDRVVAEIQNADGRTYRNHIVLTHFT
jgi:hypothetical protein